MNICVWRNKLQYYTFSSVQSLSRVRLFATPWTAACQASLSIINSWSLPKPMSTESVMPSNHLILCRPLLLLPSIFPSIRVFSNKSVLRIRWPKYWSFCFSISPSNEYSGLISFRMDCLISLQSKGVSRVFSNTTVQKHQFFGTQVNLTVSPVLSLSLAPCVSTLPLNRLWYPQGFWQFLMRAWKVDERGRTRGLPSGPVVKTPNFHCRGHKFNPWFGN